MSTRSPAPPAVVAVLKLPRAIAACIAVLKAIVLALTGNKAFPSPQPALATLSAAIAALEAAQASARTRVAGAVAARDQRLAEATAQFALLRAYVQSVAEADPANAVALVQSAGLYVRRLPSRAARTFAARQGLVSGSVSLVAASAGNRAAYDWELSPDGGKTWQPLPPTIQARTSTAGLNAGTVYTFRYRPVTRAGSADWGQPVTLLVK